MLFWPGQKAQPAAASAAAWPPQAMASMPMQMLVIDPMTKAAYGLQTLTQQTQIAKPKRETSSRYWTVYNFFASQSHHKYKIIIFFFRRCELRSKFKLFNFASQES